VGSFGAFGSPTAPASQPSTNKGLRTTDDAPAAGSPGKFSTDSVGSFGAFSENAVGSFAQFPQAPVGSFGKSGKLTAAASAGAPGAAILKTGQLTTDDGPLTTSSQLTTDDEPSTSSSQLTTGNGLPTSLIILSRERYMARPLASSNRLRRSPSALSSKANRSAARAAST
jgi:hypothetical protein